MMARANITDRLNQTGTAGLHRVHFGQCEPLRLRCAWWPQFHQRYQGCYLFALAVFLVQQFQAYLKVFVAEFGAFNRLPLAKSNESGKIRRMFLDLREKPAFLRSFGIDTAKPSDELDEVLRPQDLIESGYQLGLGKLDNQRREMRGRKVRVECDGIARKIGYTFYHWHGGFAVRVAFLQHSAFGLKFGMIKAHLLAASFGLNAWVCGAQTLRTLQSYTLEAHA